MSKLAALKARKSQSLCEREGKIKANIETIRRWVESSMEANGVVVSIPDDGIHGDLLHAQYIHVDVVVNLVVVAGIKTAPTRVTRVLVDSLELDAVKSLCNQLRSEMRTQAESNLRAALNVRAPSARTMLTRVSIVVDDGIESFAIECAGCSSTYPYWTPLDEIAGALIQQVERKSAAAMSRAALDMLEDL